MQVHLAHSWLSMYPATATKRRGTLLSDFFFLFFVSICIVSLVCYTVFVAFLFCWLFFQVEPHAFPMTLWCVDPPKPGERPPATETLLENTIAFDSDVELHQWADALSKLFESSLIPASDDATIGAQPAPPVKPSPQLRPTSVCVKL